MQIHNNTLIAECSAYDFKEMLECKKFPWVCHTIIRWQWKPEVH